MAELQKDPITRKDLLGFGILGAITTAILTIPPAAFVLGPVIRTDVLGQTDVRNDFFYMGSVSEVPEGDPPEPKLFQVNFPIDQIYAGEDAKGGEDVQEAKTKEGAQQRNEEEFVINSAVYVSWLREIKDDGTYGESLRPSFLDEEGGAENLSEEQIQEVQDALSVLSNSCAHLGCPVRWVEREGEGQFLCPCHGGIYNINGSYLAGPPPRGMYSYDFEVREDGSIYVRHEFDADPGPNGQEPFVI